ncbi:MAG: SMP-30/gluconolactonase/LRE family protein [Chitinophagaceae bacterium]|nr:MAG: SMP-30/gluconolactonase/LRE family protein [Chitinophagaceae bacterium]
MKKTWNVIEAEPSLLGEGPVWDPVSQSLYWVDILQCRIHQYFPATGKRKTVGTESMVGAIALRESGGLVAATQNGLIGIGASTKSEQLLASPEAEIPGNRFNDGKCDAAGRFWAGTMSLTGVSQAGALYMLDTDHAVTVQLPQVSCSNGLCWSKDCKTFYFIDTPTRQIAAFDFDLRSGRLSKKRIAQ